MAWNNSQWQQGKTTPVAAKPKKMSGAVKGAIAALIVVVGAGVAWMMIGNDAPAETVKPVEKKEVAKKPVKKPVAPVAKPKQVAEEKPAKVVEPKSPVAKITEQSPNAAAVEEATTETPEAAETEKPKPVFHSASDQLLAMAVGGEPGQDIPPLPIGPGVERDFKESLKNPIVINDDDPENIKAIKTAVNEAREEMKKILENGGSVADALREHEKLTRENNKIRSNAIKEYRSILESGDKEGAAEYVRTMNVAFQQMGIAPIREGARKRRKKTQE